jgi:hypothetical protein
LKLLENNLREGCHRFFHDRQDPPDHNCHAHQTGHASKGREGGNHRAGQPGPGRLWELDSSNILNLNKKLTFKFILNINLISLKKGRVYHATKYMALPTFCYMIQH